MTLGKVKVEQLDFNSEIVLDYGEILSRTELQNKFLKIFDNTEIKNGKIYGTYGNAKYCLFVKNISYLGNPHPFFKKRIQISNDFIDLYKENKKYNIQTLLLGFYKYKNTELICDFNIENYVNKKANNSSAHVYMIDLKNGNDYGYFQKRDFNGNLITVFKKNRVNDFLNSKFNKIIVNSEFEIANTFDAFFSSISKNWFGIDCYKEMIEANYNNKYQSEWAGFYLEYLMNNYIIDNNLYNIVKYEQNKKKDDIDLDLYFSKINSYGDLKTHSKSSGAILGNDYETICNLLKNGKIYYIVCNHDTNLDKENNYEVTTFWNKKLNKENLLSYGNKMKNSVHLNSYYILEINKYNFQYVTKYNQGKNSNGKERKPKISISNKNIDNFLIHAVYFDEKD